MKEPITNNQGKEYHHIACIKGTDIWFNPDSDPLGAWHFCYVIPSRDPRNGNCYVWDNRYWYIDGACETFEDSGMEGHLYEAAEEKAILEYIHFHHKLMS
jgi:hypothetical protein